MPPNPALQGLNVQNYRLPDGQSMDIELDVGQTLVIMGPSGCGKSMLLRTLADLDPHTATVNWRGMDQASLPAPQWRQQVAYLPAESVWWYDTVGEHFPPSAELLQLLQQLELPADCLDWSIHRISSGEKQRMAIARLLQRKPDLLLLDEPTANLDATRTQLVERVLLAFAAKHGSTLIWVTHDEAQAQRVAHRTLHFPATQAAGAAS
uniref:Putative transporter subunit: ATP-binding component of ABC superfamily n=1 Tax=Magnetococcus massalia (strain MO-1) TaxID=451514 RepID=A0A1S7LGW1_MAGMO|nr:putative transporter subunit: ATP-binding component of ABC superfamily [Candidatus Magnetococcus massalia]